MLEDSITSSPSKNKTPIHKVRLLRRTKRKQQVDCENDQLDLHNVLREFYFDSEENSNLIASKPLDSTFSIANPTSIVDNYKPFQLEKSYVIADHVAPNTSRKLKSIQKETQGFLTCQRLTESEPLTINATPENTSFTITETELIACCNQVEKKFCNIPSRTKERSPTSDDISLVNSILEDFSQSPLGKDQITNHMSWQCTPEYRLRRKPLKTYSRQFLNKTRTDLSKRFDTQSPVDEEHDNNSSCSSLSVQEDNGLIENVSTAPVSSSDTSQRICENLLNLSVYFTQNDQCTMYTDAMQQNEMSSSLAEIIPANRVRDLIQEILNLRANYRGFKHSNDSLEDFYGFSDCTNFVSDKKDLQSNTRSNLNQTVSNPSEITFSPNKAYSAAANSEGINFLKDWNGEEIFTCINTEEIIEEHNKYLVSKQTSHAENCDKVNQISFKTSKTPGIVSKPPEIPIATEEATSSNCDNTNLIEGDVNLFENLEGYELNDDCDLFLNFQTPIPVNEQPIIEPLDRFKKVLIPLHQLQHPQSHEANVPCNSKVSNQGFKTASGKNVSISEKAQESVEKLLNEFNTKLNESYNCDDLRDMKNNIYNKMHIKKTNISINDSIIEKNYNDNQLMNSTRIENGMKKNVGFQTANGKNVKISAKAQESVKQLLGNIAIEAQDNLDNDLLFMKKRIIKKNLELKGLNPSSTLKRDETNESNAFHTDTKVTNAVTPFIESVQEANKNVNKEQVEASHSLEKPMLENNDDFDEIIFSKLPFVNLCENPISNVLQNDIKERDLLKIGAPADNLNVNIGFQTANGKKVSISAKAQQAAKKLLQDVAEVNILDVNNTTEMESKLKEIKVNLINKNKQLKKESSSTKHITGQTCPKNVNGTSNESSHLNYNAGDTNKSENNIATELNNLNKNIGFKTANGKSVSISANAQSAVQKLLQGFETDLDAETYESNLEKLKIDIQNKNKLNNNVKCIETQNYSQEINEYANIVLSEWPLNNTVLNTTPIVKNGKRKYSINKSDTTLADYFSPPPTKILKKSLHSTKSSLVEQSLKSPLARATNSVILRKNLLSLTKRRKNKTSTLSNVNEGTTKLNQEKHEENSNIITPIKTISSVIDSNITPATPNFREFFSNAPDTSTPRNDDNVCKSAQIINDSDFKPIQWNVHNNDNENNLNKSQTQSTHTTRITETSSSNITLNSSNPTAKERIGRLKMYGKAPDISPILIDTHNTHNCRPSGLRRTRSMLKKTENN